MLSGIEVHSVDLVSLDEERLRGFLDKLSPDGLAARHWLGVGPGETIEVAARRVLAVEIAALTPISVGTTISSRVAAVIMDSEDPDPWSRMRRAAAVAYLTEVQ